MWYSRELSLPSCEASPLRGNHIKRMVPAAIKPLRCIPGTQLILWHQHVDDLWHLARCDWLQIQPIAKQPCNPSAKPSRFGCVIGCRMTPKWWVSGMLMREDHLPRIGIVTCHSGHFHGKISAIFGGVLFPWEKNNHWWVHAKDPKARI